MCVNSCVYGWMLASFRLVVVALFVCVGVVAHALLLGWLGVVCEEKEKGKRVCV